MPSKIALLRSLGLEVILYSPWLDDFWLGTRGVKVALLVFLLWGGYCRGCRFVVFLVLD